MALLGLRRLGKKFGTCSPFLFVPAQSSCCCLTYQLDGLSVIFVFITKGRLLLATHLLLLLALITRLTLPLLHSGNRTGTELLEWIAQIPISEP